MDAQHRHRRNGHREIGHRLLGVVGPGTKERTVPDEAGRWLPLAPTLNTTPVLRRRIGQLRVVRGSGALTRNLM
jgi:hypothetical protein